MGDTRDDARDAHGDETTDEYPDDQPPIDAFGDTGSAAIDFVRDSDAGDCWGTPVWVVDPLRDAIDGFDLDPASGAEPEPYAETRFTEEDDGLSHNWFGDVWLNPPYGRDANPEWGRKVAREWEAGDVDTITALLPGNTGTEWFGSYYAPAGTITHLHERLEFHGAGEDNATFDSVIVSFGEFPDEYYEALATLGAVYDRRFEPEQAGLTDFN